MNSSVANKKFLLTGIADIGGLLGLFLGCSLLSLVEVIYFVFFALTKALRGNKFTETANINQMEASDSEIVKLREELKNLSNHFENIEKSKVLKRIAKLEKSEKKHFRKISNLERNSLIVADL